MYAIHLARPDMPPLALWYYRAPSPVDAPAEAKMNLLGEWGHRRHRAASSLLPGATKINDDDVRRMVGNGRFADIPDGAWSGWEIDLWKATLFLPEDEIPRLDGTDEIEILCAIGITRVKRPDGSKYLDVQSIAPFRLAGSLDLPVPIAIDSLSATQFTRVAAAEKQYAELLEQRRALPIKRARDSLEVALAERAALSRENIKKALGSKAELARLERERIAAEEARVAAVEAERRRLEEERIARNPVAALNDEDLAAKLRALRASR